MKTCVICGNKTGVFAFKCADGSVCSDCESHIPISARKYLKQAPAYIVERTIENDRKTTAFCRKNFVETASYGCLRLDECHGLFAICDEKMEENGRLKAQCHDVFSALYVKDFALSIQNMEASPNSVKVSVVFTAEMDKPIIRLKRTLKTATCYVKRLDETHITYTEPSDLTLFRNIMNQMVRDAWERFDYKNRQDLITPRALELFKARALFMLGEGYTENELKKQRNRLIKAFHPDEGEEEMTKYATIVNESYKILREEL